MKREKERIIRSWFEMWLHKEDTDIQDLFEENAVYIESWGPEYHGAEKIKHWFYEWNTRGEVLKWDIKQIFHSENQTIVFWFFECEMKDGIKQSFDGISAITWSTNQKITKLQEYGCNTGRYDPYADGESPVFRDEKSLWF